MKTISVIVGSRITDRLSDRPFETPTNSIFSSLDQAWSFGEIKKAEGMNVIVRPNYNEEDSAGRFYREWRSFNGEDFRECRWRV